MVDIQTVSIAVASASVAVGIFYYALQIRHQTRMRQTDLVMKLYSQFDNLEFQKVLREVLNRQAKDFHDYEEKYGWAEYTTVGLFFEGIGILLKRKLIDIELVDDMFTTDIKWTWKKMKDITLEARKVQNQPEILEWFEHLYNEMKKREQTGVENG